jgi:uncharacterized NAD(P)/FAD-binding protein YdhS
VTQDRLTFASRRLCGSYIKHILGNEIWSTHSRHRFYLVGDDAVGLHCLEVSYCQRHQVAVALAMANFQPEGGMPGYAENPWEPNVLTSLHHEAPVLLVGTGLTMVDVVISRSTSSIAAPSMPAYGLLPRTHAPVAPVPRFLSPATAPRSVCGLLHAAMLEVERVSAAGGDWRAVIDSLRPDVQAL